MSRSRVAALAAGVAALALPLAAAVPAAAQDDVETFRANVDPLNNSGASGTVTIELDPGTNMIDVTANITGVVPDAPHAQHLHFGPEASHTCPTMDLADSEAGNDVQTNPDVLASVEARQAYGPVDVSLTTEGPTDPASALALERFPTAPDGNIDYQRSGIQLTDQQVGYLTSGQYVFAAHGIDYTGDGKYSPETAPSPLAVAALGEEQGSSIPLEGTAPYGCGVVTAAQVDDVPEGEVEAGGGATDGIEYLGLLTLGGVAAAGAGVTLAVRHRRNQHS